MSAKFLDLCEKQFATRNLYRILDLNQHATAAEVKSAYRKMSLIIHPDRANIGDEKFTTLAKAHEILIDPVKRALYDKTGNVNIEENVCPSYIVSDDDLSNCYESYAGSECEKHEIQNAYVTGKGNMNYVMKHVPFLIEDDRARVAAIVQELLHDVCAEPMKKTSTKKKKRCQVLDTFDGELDQPPPKRTKRQMAVDAKAIGKI